MLFLLMFVISISRFCYALRYELVWKVFISKCFRGQSCEILFLSIARKIVLIPILHIFGVHGGALLAFIVGLLWHPFDQFTAEPEAFLLNEIELIAHVTDPIFDSVAPEASIRLRAEVPHVGAPAMPDIVQELSSVLSRAIKPLQFSHALLRVIDPLTFILYAIGPYVHSMAVDVVILERSSVNSTIRTRQRPCA